MRAFAINKYGGPEVLKEYDLPIPEVGDYDVLIEVENTGVSPYDWHVRRGEQAGKINYPIPLILGWDVSGIVRKIGKNVKALKEGDAVIATQQLNRNGGYAEYIAVNEQTVVKKPNSLSFEEGATIPINGLTVYQALMKYGKMSKGDRVFIQGGAGGVGIFGIQLAKAKGAYVATTASEHNHEFLKTLGADKTIDYHKENFTDVISDYDIVLDTQGGHTLAQSYEVLKEGGRLISIRGQVDKEKANKKNIEAYFVWTKLDRDDLIKVVNLYGDGTIKAYFDTIFPLSEVRKAHERSEKGHVRGKIVLKIKA
ncbi:NADP-dependent oxidoreductase [Bacillus subtilis]|uniref:NADP-dependent oxidoreductase n=1 Tax=Bacillus subtilis TaxID=1423 RepID=UPI00301AD189